MPRESEHCLQALYALIVEQQPDEAPTRYGNILLLAPALKALTQLLIENMTLTKFFGLAEVRLPSLYGENTWLLSDKRRSSFRSIPKIGAGRVSAKWVKRRSKGAGIEKGRLTQLLARGERTEMIAGGLAALRVHPRRLHGRSSEHFFGTAGDSQGLLLLAGQRLLVHRRSLHSDRLGRADHGHAADAEPLVDDPLRTSSFLSYPL